MKLNAVDTPTTRDHFAMNPWLPGEERLTFHLTLDAAPEVLGAAATLQHAVSDQPLLRPVPSRWLHLTMTGFGGVDSVSAGALDEVSTRVFEQWAQYAGERIAYDQVLLADESLMLTARNDPWLQQLVTVQREAVDAVLGERAWANFWPHTTVAYATGDADVAGVSASLVEPAASLPDVLEARPTLTLMALSRDTGDYAWRVLRSQGPQD